jgi:DNA-binding transcriptional LysR family regulator
MRQTTRSIQLFVAAYEELSFTVAAHRENATQSGVSQHVSDLEDSLGVKLFTRGVGSVQPTPAGTAYYSACIEFLNAHERTVRAVKPFQGSREGEITVGMTPVMTRAVLAPAYARFTAENPNVIIRIIDSYFGDLTDRVRAGELTFAIVPSSTGSKGLRTSLFARTPEMLVSGKDSPLKHCAPVRLAEIGPLKLAIPGPNNARRKMIDAYMTSNGIVVKHFAEFDTMLGTLDLVSRGQWSAILPMLTMMPRDFNDGTYTINPIVDPPLILETFVLQPARKTLDEVALTFLHYLREEAEAAHSRAAQLIRQAGHQQR